MSAERPRSAKKLICLDEVVLSYSDGKNLAEGVEGGFMGGINHGPRKSTFAVALKSHVLFGSFLFCQPQRLPVNQREKNSSGRCLFSFNHLYSPPSITTHHLMLYFATIRN